MKLLRHIAPLFCLLIFFCTTADWHNVPSKTSVRFSAETPLSTDNNAVFKVATNDAAVPVRVETIHVPAVNLSGRQQHKQQSQSIYGIPANYSKTQYCIKQIWRSVGLLVSLMPPDISFPFSAFW